MTSRSRIEQAVFTSARTEKRDGYHVVATSSGVDAQDAHDLTVWSPSHDSLNKDCRASGSINYFHLSRGAHCISRSVAAGTEYSQRGGKRIYSQCLIIPHDVMVRFSCNPFRIDEAVSASGRWKVFREVPSSLDSFRLVGRASPIDVELLDEVVDSVGAHSLTVLAQAALSTGALAIRGGPAPDRLLSALLSLFPPACRPSFTFSTGLAQSPRRPFRLIVLDSECQASVLERLKRQSDTAVFDFERFSIDAFPTFGSWMQWIESVLTTRDWQSLDDVYRRSPQMADLTKIDELAPSHSAKRPCIGANNIAASVASKPKSPAPASLSTSSDKSFRHAHTKHNTKRSIASSNTNTSKPQSTLPPETAGPQRLLNLLEGPMLEKLDELDESVIGAITGQADALENVRRLWPYISEKLDENLLHESRFQYLRFALRNWIDRPCDNGIRDPSAAAPMLDVLAILFAEEAELSH